MTTRRRWDAETIHATLEPIIAELGRFPKREELSARGLSGLSTAMGKLGGVAEWRKRFADAAPAAPAAPEAPTAVEVVEVVEGSPAARAGVRPEDLVVAVEESPVHGVNDLQRLMTADRIDREVVLEVVRGGERRRLRLVPRELPSGRR